MLLNHKKVPVFVGVPPGTRSYTQTWYCDLPNYVMQPLGTRRDHGRASASSPPERAHRDDPGERQVREEPKEAAARLHLRNSKLGGDFVVRQRADHGERRL